MKITWLLRLKLKLTDTIKLKTYQDNTTSTDESRTSESEQAGTTAVENCPEACPEVMENITSNGVNFPLLCPLPVGLT